MSELYKIILTSSLTILGGVVVYVTGQIISKFFIEPIHEQKKIIGEIADALIFYANVYCNPGTGSKKKMNEASERLRQLATLLHSKTHLIPWYKFFEKIRVVVESSSIEKASTKLIGLSNSTIINIPPNNATKIALKNSETADEIKKLLKLRIK